MINKFTRPNHKSIYKYLYLVVIIVNLALIVCLYNFVNKYVIGALFPDQLILSDQLKSVSQNKDILTFEKTLELIEKKQTPNEVDGIDTKLFQ